ncbi:hypothetical protein EG329_002988 [Mollisiaceae sp. DMI_Dod_QoI]|nr:hypothetical protein EG329_002988 [Helotiales sp. DMI_Dod_QoI]
MAAPDLLERKLFSAPLSSDARLAILNKMFDDRVTEAGYESQKAGFESYFNHWYEEQCSHRTGQISNLSHQDLLHIIELVKDPAATYDSTKAAIPQRLPGLTTEAQIEGVLILAARVWSISSIGNISQCLSFGSNLSWDHNSLSETLNCYYKQPSKAVEFVKIPKIFNAVNLNQIAGIRICWTSNLLDHLKMTDDDKRVHIFHHVSFLKLHQQTDSPVLSIDLIEETINTMSLLLPQNDEASNRWFEKKRRTFGLDPSAATNGHLNSASRRIDKFNYWGDRLSILKQAFDESEPKSVAQWWYDDRKRVQWYTFWIAALVLLLTIVFGSIQSVCSIIQAWASVKALNI